MKIWKLVWWGVLIGIALGITHTYAFRFLPGVKILPRSARGADETWKYASNPIYQQYLEYLEQQDQKFQQLKTTNPALYEQKLKAIEINKARNQYLLQNFSWEFKIDKVITGENGNELWTPRAYHYNKTKIVIHHTAWGEDIKTPDDAKAYIRNIYKFHALTRKRGDIGYNFIIDPWGNIYEGRSWGEGVVGMHTKYNNTASVGIALIGNFDQQQPTKEQLIALIKLIVALSKKYKIDPLDGDAVSWHKKINSAPYIQDIQDYPIVGHQDAGYTSCPWKNLDKILPKIREIASNILKKSVKLSASTSSWNQQQDEVVKQTGVVKPTRYKRFSQSIAFDKIFVFSFQAPKWFALKDCKLVEGQNVILKNCEKQGDRLVFELQWQKYKASGTIKILAEGRAQKISISKPIIWIEDLTKFALARKQKYLKSQNVELASFQSSKINHKISLSNQKELAQSDVKVLLWEASFLPQWNLSCVAGCKLIFGDGSKHSAKSVIVIPREGNLKIYANGKTYSSNQLVVQSDDLIKITNYTRQSYAGIPWNIFEGKLVFKKQKIKLLDWTWQNQYVLINQLPFDKYMQGVAEANDQMPFEKTKAMALIAKSYMLFYMDKQNKHPAIPQDGFYNAIDDGRFFQKYVGAWFKKTSKNWGKARNWAKSRYALYNDHLPILPYFNCSAGFTWSAKEKFWWLDTPYLRTRLDFYKCRDFKGHWVGLSGKWAEVLAKKWANAEFILKYFYPGVEIVR